MPLKINPLVAMIEESILLRDSAQRILSRELGGPSLTRLEGLVLVSIVGSERAMTAAQIGRALGSARQVVQRAAGRLQELGLVRKVPNPDHKTAALLEPTAKGVKYEAELGAVFDKIVDGILSEQELKRCQRIAKDIGRIRSRIEGYDSSSGQDSNGNFPGSDAG